MRKTLYAIAFGIALITGCSKKSSNKSVTPTPPVTTGTNRLTFIIDTVRGLNRDNTVIYCYDLRGYPSNILTIDSFKNWVNVSGSLYRIDIDISYDTSTFSVVNRLPVKDTNFMINQVFGAMVAAPMKPQYTEIYKGDTLNKM